MTPSTENGSQMLPEAAGVTDMSLVERVVDAIGACMVGSSLEEQAIAALEASGHAELVEALNEALEMVLEASQSGNFNTEEFQALNLLVAKHTGEQS
jgi:hypothetical protein